MENQDYQHKRIGKTIRNKPVQQKGGFFLETLAASILGNTLPGRRLIMVKEQIE